MLVRERTTKLLLVVFSLLFLLSCDTGKNITRPDTPSIMVKKEPIIAIVLGGGSAKGFAHVGVLRVLEQEKIPIHMVVGTSVGSLIGGIYAANPDSFQLEWIAFKIDRGDILDFSINPRMGTVPGIKLESFVEQNVKARKVEDTKIPFYPIATDLSTGETLILEKGSLAKAIHASSAIPGIFAPVAFGNRTLVDGGVANNIACDIARAKGADIVIAVNLQKDIKTTQFDSLIDVIGQSISIMMKEASKPKLAVADVVIEPETKGIGMFDFTQKKLLMEEGIKSAKVSVPRIKELIAKFGATKK